MGYWDKDKMASDLLEIETINEGKNFSYRTRHAVVLLHLEIKC
jgi:hypothetical protein